MQFIYIEKTIDAPQKINLLGYEFILNGNAVNVTDPKAVFKMEQMAHVGIIRLDQLDKVEIKKDKPVVKKKPFKDAFKELTPNATRQHIVNVVNSKTADYLVEYVNYFKLEVSKEDKQKIKKPELTKTTLQKYLLADLQRRFKESKEEIKEDNIDVKIKELIDSKTYNQLMSFVKSKQIKTADTKKDTLIEAVTQYLKENGTN